MRIYRCVGVATAAGAEVLTEAPRSVKTIDPSTIFERFM